MPKGPQGQKRPADVIGNAVLIAKIATEKTEERNRHRKDGGCEAVGLIQCI